jgi:glyoxylase-like metal-dependent hydrolase (beta-lactamase superfamily II)
MLEAVADGPVLRLRLGRPLAGRVRYEVSAYLLQGVLVDTGPPATAGELLRYLEAHGHARELRAAVHTHHHEDHTGGSPLLARALGVPILAPRASVDLLALRRRVPIYRRLVWGRPQPCAALAFDEELEVGGLAFQAVPTPGHAFDHVCLFEPERRWLFSGDLYVHERVRFLRRIEDPWAHLDSLRRVRALEPRRMFCAHAGPIDDPVPALERKIRFWEDLATRAEVLRARGWSLRRLRQELLGHEELFTYLSLGDFSKTNLVRALLARPPVAAAEEPVSRG